MSGARTLLAASALVLHACATTPKPVTGVCSQVLPRSDGSSGARETHPEWFALLLHGYDGTPGFFTRPLSDCTGTPLLWAGEGNACEEVARFGEPLPATPLGARDLLLTEVRPGLSLAWAVTRRFTNGEGLGPAALVETTAHERIVHAVGPLRAKTEAALRLETVGHTQLLVAEGAFCPDGDAAPCERTVQIVPRRNNRFIAEPFIDDRGACVGPAVFHLFRTRTVKLPTGWERRFELSTAVSFTPTAIHAQEQMVVKDSDPRQPGTPPRIFRKAQNERTVRVERNRLVTTGPSLWGRVARLSEE